MSYTETVAYSCNPFSPRTVKTWVWDTSTVLLTVSPDGSTSSRTLKSDTATSYAVFTLNPDVADYGYNSGLSTTSVAVIPDGQGDTLAAWLEWANPPALPFIASSTLIKVTHRGVTYSLPIMTGDTFELVLGKTGWPSPRGRA